VRPGDIARGANQVLADLGVPQTRALEEIDVRMPTPEEVRRLNLVPGTPVAFHICTGFTDDGTPVRVVLNVLPGDRHVIVDERSRPEPQK
jgi:GntR family transcriptional regulator